MGGKEYIYIHSRDYDHDGLPDYYEYESWKYYEKVKNTANKVSKYLMLNNSKDAQEDFDGDGLTNLQEYERDHGGIKY